MGMFSNAIGTAAAGLTIASATGNLPAAPADAAKANGVTEASSKADKFLPPAREMAQVSTIISVSPNGKTAIMVQDYGKFGKVNGQMLPPDFQPGAHTDGILFSKDLKHFATTDAQRKLVVGEVPDSGIVLINGKQYDLTKGIESNPKDKVSTVMVPASSIPNVATGEPTGGAPARSTRTEHLVDGSKRNQMEVKVFAGVTRIEVDAIGIGLNRVDGDKVEAKDSWLGDAKVENGVLKLKGFTGKLNIPPTVTSIVINSSGPVSGVISTPGEINCKAGNVFVRIPDTSGLAVDAEAKHGKVACPMFADKGNGRFEPKTGTIRGTLKIRAETGDATVRQVKSTD